MAYEKRGQRRYFYVSERRGARVKKRYFGSGPTAEIAAKQFTKRKAARERDRLESQVRIEQLTKDGQQVKDVDQQIQAHIHAYLIDAGYYRHKRGEWRKRRIKK